MLIKRSAANLTSLVSVFGAVANTTQGMALLAGLAGSNKTVFAPSNIAFANVSSSVAMNTTLLTEILSYHVLNDTYLPAGVAVSPAHTIARTFLGTPMDGYMLPGNKTAPLVLSRNETNSTSIFVAQALDNVTAMGPVMVANLAVYIIDEVLALPNNFTVAGSIADPPLATLVNMTTFFPRLDAAHEGATVFAPDAMAITKAMSLSRH